MSELKVDIPSIVLNTLNALLTNDDETVRRNVQNITQVGLFHLANVVVKEISKVTGLTITDKQDIVTQVLHKVIQTTFDEVKSDDIQRFQAYVEEHLIEACNALEIFAEQVIDQCEECISDKIARWLKNTRDCLARQISSLTCCCRRNKASS
jgi:hypothetical protein